MLPERLTRFRSTILIPVFLPAILVVALLVIGTISDPDRAGELFATLLRAITADFGWFYVLAVATFLVFLVVVAVSPWGRIKLGPDHARPEYSFSSWFAMLFSAGYGIALLFFGVAEPVLHYANPPEAEALTRQAAEQALQISFFHWGFHIWAIYGLVGLVLAYFAFRQGLPLSMRSALYPLIGERIYGPIGHTVDVFAILGTLFGLATTLGISVTQINSGLNYLWPGIPVHVGVQIGTIAIITSLATVSVVAGMDRGIRRLSLINMILAALLVLFVFLVGPTIFILEAFVQNTGAYLDGIIARTFNLQAYVGGEWIGNWTLFIFGWTIAWAPFVGLFIAKISRGRTIRQFVFGVMLVPTLFTFFWFSVFGDTALHAIMHEGYTALIDEVNADQAIALFKLFEHLPFTAIVSFVTILLIVTFFVTSADSGALVIDSLASGGALKTPVVQRIFWAALSGVVASVLLLAGGLKALQTAAVTSALPFAIIMLIAGVGLWQALRIESQRDISLQYKMTSGRTGIASKASWQDRITSLVTFPDRESVAGFIRENVRQAMDTVATELEERGWPVSVSMDEERPRARLTVNRPGFFDFFYEVRLQSYAKPTLAFPQIQQAGSGGERYYRAEVFMRRGGRAYDIYGYDTDLIIEDIIDQFERYLHFVRTSPGVLPWRMDEFDDDLKGEADRPPK
ncbi:BCCT family transporter [Guyparkeria sp.]|uniref:BCCT family transporter n=1 Tax=Guyparkeria sp. TaxID=2035736 RepID=UPI0039710988